MTFCLDRFSILTNEVYMAAQKTDGYILMQDLKPDYAYLISARNAYVGIWNPKVNGFVISREKLGRHYLFYEYHWDVGEPLGTVKPIKELEKSQVDFCSIAGDGRLSSIELAFEQETRQYLDGLMEAYPVKELIIELAKKSCYFSSTDPRYAPNKIS